MTNKAHRSVPGNLREPSISVRWMDDPVVAFANSGVHTDPKIGIPLYGPRSFGTPRHPAEIHVGYVGEMEAIEKVRRFVQECTKGVAAADRQNGSVAFPGLHSDVGFRIKLIESDALIEPITVAEKDKLLQQSGLHAKFDGLLSLFEEKVSILCDKDYPLDYIFLALSEDIYSKLRILKQSPTSPPPHRSLRRALKARLMKFGAPTQLIRDSTTGYTDDERDLQDLATRAWNLFTAMYYKAGGLPWSPIGLEPSTCFVGVSFYRPLGEPSSIRASIAQAFDEFGEGLILRGQKFRWNQQIDKSPHLGSEHAEQLISEVLHRYQLECNHTPKRIVIHKSSRFDPEERAGFTKAMVGVSRYDLLTVGKTSAFRLLRAGTYPPLRGTAAIFGDNHLLYTTGYLRGSNTYPHGHVPSPLRIIDHYGDTPKEQLLRELLILTKMNWNSANVDGAYPITLQFARLVGEILQEIPQNMIPNVKYAYYM